MPASQGHYGKWCADVIHFHSLCNIPVLDRRD